MFNKKAKSGSMKKGETIVEVLVALVVLTIGAATATSLIVTALRSNQFDKDSLVALNLAQEGLEYMHNLRDTNWLKFSANTQGCWNTKPNSTSCDTSGVTTVLQPSDGTHEYALGLNAAGQTDLAYIASKLDVSDGVTATTEDKYELNYYNNGDYVGSSAPVAMTLSTQSKFYRSIDVAYFTIAGASPWTVSPTANPLLADMMQVSSTVEWMDSSAMHQVKLTSALTRYK